MELCWPVDDRAEVVAWGRATANAPDRAFLPLVAGPEGRTVTPADAGFGGRGGPPSLKVRRRGARDERLLIETAFSLLHRVCRLKHPRHRAAAYVEMRLAHTAALFNVLLTLAGRPARPRIAQFGL